MSTSILSLVEGWTGLLGPFTLLVDAVPFSLTGFTVTLVLRDSDGNLVTTGGVVSLLDQTLYPGQVTYAPIATDFVFRTGRYVTATVYHMHWKVVDGDGKVVFFPNDESVQLEVHRA
jgi:hypothetical protein